ncbi:hypothetical protein GWK36_14565 [Caldichromatium japonicum]|uniref:Phage-Barnase-EndoU-ColicinE5/D-RelE like nuclease 3 domain-containing protein n=1 Tax=Caldichromatium japonicum TaxID=2699430 RepID=A0A6G7VGM2_9GAMM|nr:hypothetical protein [Caldichromatium japonicum]QIK39015.1 hypothetical protein GWK36_14565 [Caldichromatium japonicum]
MTTRLLANCRRFCTYRNRQAKQSPLVLKSLSGGIAAALETLGVKPRTRDFALDHDYVLYIHDSHGLDKERLRGQEPITVEDLLKIGDLIKNALSIKLGTPARSRNGAMRIEAEAGDGVFVYRIVLEVRRRYVVPFTMYKRKK